MGCSVSKSCFPKFKKSKAPIDNQENIVPLNNVSSIKTEISKSNSNNFSKPLKKQYLLNNKLSSSEIHLLNLLREEKDKSKRPNGIDLPKFVRNKPIIRLASWNLNNLTVEKIKNPGVLSVICLTILENHFSIIALQEVNNIEAAKRIVDELNNPSLTKIKLHLNSRNWDYITSDESLGKTFQGQEFGVLIYDKSRKIEILQNSQLVNTKNFKSFARNPFFVNIKIDQSIFLLSVFHIKAVNFVNALQSRSNMVDEIKDLALLAVALKESLKPGHRVIFLGDFNQEPMNECFDSLRQANYMFCIDSVLATNTSKVNAKAYDNIWINKSCEEYYSGFSGVISEGLCHPHIPKFALNGWGGFVSDHCPVWADFFVHV